MTEKICRHNKHGHCKYGEKCNFRHINEKCSTKNCKVSDCEKRHPKICIFKRRFGYCKFTTYCSYDHEKSQDIVEISDKILKLEDELKNLQQKQKPTEEFNNKVELFENKVKVLVQIIEGKYGKIQNLEKRIVKLENDKDEAVKNLKTAENDFSKRLMEMDKKFDLVVVKNKLSEKRESEQLKCKECEFTTTSTKGLKTHIKRKHTINFPIKCDVCDKELKTKQQMKHHMVSHTYLYEEDYKLKCQECDFVGKNAWSMQIHQGKCHIKNIECGLCEYRAKDNEQLDIHIKTCEIYECNHCEYGTKTLSEMRKHKTESSECLTSSVFHVKVDRKFENEADSKEYQHEELFD